MKNLLSLCIFIGLLFACAKPRDKTDFEILVSEGTNIAVCPSPNRDESVIDLQGSIYLIMGNGTEAKRLTDIHLDARQPVFSPDGEQIAFQGYGDGNWHIYVIDREGTHLNQLTKGLYDRREPYWSPDGRFLYYSGDSLGNYDIWRLNIENNQEEIVIHEESEDFAPALNKDGSKLAFIQKTGAEYKITLYDLIKGAQISSYLVEAGAFAPSWIYLGDKDGTDSERIAYVNQSGIELSLRFYDPLSISSKTEVLSEAGEDVFPFRLAQKGSEFYYTSDGKVHILNFENDSRDTYDFKVRLAIKKDSYLRKKMLSADNENKQAKAIYQPRISPDGNKIVFIAMAELWVHEINGSTRRLTNNKSIELNAVWHDENTIYFTADDSAGVALFRFHLQDGEIQRVSPLIGHPAGMAFDHSGKQLALAYSFGPRAGRIDVLNLESGKSQAGRMLGYSPGVPSWMTDNRRIITSLLQPYSHLYREGINRPILIDTQTGEIRNLRLATGKSLGSRSSDSPIISNDGSSVYYLSLGQLWKQNISEDGISLGDAESVTDELTDAFSLSADDRYLLYMATDRLKRISLTNGEILAPVLNLPLGDKDRSPAVLIHNASILNPEGTAFIENQDLRIEGNKIVGIAREIMADEEDIVLDASGLYVIPGLIDMHAHQGSESGESLGRSWLSWGVTSTRDPSSNPYDALNRKEAIQSGNLTGPRIFFTGSPIDGNRVYYGGTLAQESEKQIERELARAKSLDYDMLKTYVRLRDESQKKVIEFAHEMGIPVSSHEIYPAAAYGVDGVEHILGTSRRWYSPKMSLGYKSYEDAIQIIASSGMSFTPTTGIYSSYLYELDKNPEYSEDERFKKFVPAYLQGLRSFKTEEDRKKAKKEFEISSSMVRKLSEAGALIIAGTDSPIYPFGLSLHLELNAYQDAGLSPAEVLKTATLNASKMLGTEKELGSIESGKLADLLILTRNPLEDIRNLRSVSYVLADGIFFQWDDLVY